MVPAVRHAVSLDYSRVLPTVPHRPRPSGAPNTPYLGAPNPLPPQSRAHDCFGSSEVAEVSAGNTLRLLGALRGATVFLPQSPSFPPPENVLLPQQYESCFQNGFPARADRILSSLDS